MLASLARGLDRLSAALNAVAVLGAVLAVAVMLYAAGWQVVARYLLASPPVWTEELARRAMVWAGMLGASVAFRAGADPSLFPQFARLRGRLGLVLGLIRAAGVLLFAAPILWFSVYGANMNPARGFLARSLGRSAEMLQVPMIWFTAAVPLAFALIVIHLAAKLALLATDQDDPGLDAPAVLATEDADPVA